MRNSFAGGDEAPGDGRTARRLDSLHRITDSIVRLVRRGVLDPSADEVARESGLSRALVFRYFRDKESLRRPIAIKLEQYGRRLLGDPIPAALPFSRRVDLLVERHCRMLEAVTPYRRATLVHEPYSREVAESQARSRAQTRRMIQEVLGAEIQSLPPAARRRLLDELHVVMAWPSWESLRKHYKRNKAEAEKIVKHIVRAILRETLPSQR